jgi:hypothetical protein
MSDQRDPEATPEELQEGAVDSDDTTQADAGLAGGTGAAPGEGAARPYGTELEGKDD